MSSVQQLLSSFRSQFRRNFDSEIMLFFIVFYITSQIAVRKLAPYPTNVKSMRNPRKEEQLYYGEIVSTIHAFISLALIFYLWGTLGLALNQFNKPEHFYLFSHQVAYFGIDFVFSKLFQYADLMNDVHHFLSFSSTFIVFFLPYGAPQSAVGLFVAQISNPCLQSRNTLRRLGYNSGSFYQLIEYLFVGIFLLFRFILTIPSILIIYQQNNCPIILKYACSTIYALSMIWVLQVINKLWKAIKECITHSGRKELGPRGQFIETIVKFMTLSFPGKVLVLIYVIIGYYVIPIRLYLH